MLAFHLTTISHLGLLLFALQYGPRKGRVWQAICIGPALSAVMEFAYYCPLVHRHPYEVLKWVIDALSSVIDLYVMLGYIFESDDARLFALATVVTVFWYQMVKLQWHWAADLFRAPTGFDSYLNPLRVWSSWIVLCVYACVTYSEGRRLHHE